MGLSLARVILFKFKLSHLVCFFFFFTNLIPIQWTKRKIWPDRGENNMTKHRSSEEEIHTYTHTHTVPYNQRLKVEGCQRLPGYCDRPLVICIND